MTGGSFAFPEANEPGEGATDLVPIVLDSTLVVSVNDSLVSEQEAYCTNQGRVPSLPLS
jgi:hypothetical protein